MRSDALEQREGIADAIARVGGERRWRQHRINGHNFLQERRHDAKRVPQNGRQLSHNLTTLAQFKQRFLAIIRIEKLSTCAAQVSISTEQKWASAYSHDKRVDDPAVLDRRARPVLRKRSGHHGRKHGRLARRHAKHTARTARSGTARATATAKRAGKHARRRRIEQRRRRRAAQRRPALRYGCRTT